MVAVCGQRAVEVFVRVVVRDTKFGGGVVPDRCRVSAGRGVFLRVSVERRLREKSVLIERGVSEDDLRNRDRFDRSLTSLLTDQACVR